VSNGSGDALKSPSWLADDCVVETRLLVNVLFVVVSLVSMVALVMTAHMG